MKRALVFTLLLLSAPAGAYVRQRTSDGTPLAYRSGCLFLTPDAAGTKSLDINTTVAQIKAATQNWMTAAASCTYLKFMVDNPVSGKTAGLDGTNLVIWLKDRWGHTSNGQFMAYSPEVPAQTTIIYVDDSKNSNNGQILDSDTELNDINFTFGVVDMAAANCGATDCVMDIQNVLTHEFGHSMGLDHTCYNNETPVHPVDQNGNPTPNCFSAAAMVPAITEATMYNFACCGENKKRSPEADDVAGMCDIYPAASDPRTCDRVQPHGSSGCACVVGGGREDSALGILGIVTALACIRIRRRSGCAPASCDRPRSSGAA